MRTVGINTIHTAGVTTVSKRQRRKLMLLRASLRIDGLESQTEKSSCCPRILGG
jgi:hypothetical protein